jgi:hypothetical protein
MIIVTVRTIHNEKLDVAVEDKNVKSVISLFQNSESVREFKISLSEGILATDLYKDFGMGQCSKFVTKFNWENS